MESDSDDDDDFAPAAPVRPRPAAASAAAIKHRKKVATKTKTKRSRAGQQQSSTARKRRKPSSPSMKRTARRSRPVTPPDRPPHEAVTCAGPASRVSHEQMQAPADVVSLLSSDEDERPDASLVSRPPDQTGSSEGAGRGASDKLAPSSGGLSSPELTESPMLDSSQDQGRPHATPLSRRRDVTYTADGIERGASAKPAYCDSGSSSPMLAESSLLSSFHGDNRGTSPPRDDTCSPDDVERDVLGELTQHNNGSSSPELAESPLLTSSPLLAAAGSQGQGLTQLLDEFSEPQSPVSEPEEAPKPVGWERPQDMDVDGTDINDVSFDAPRWLQSEPDGGVAPAGHAGSAVEGATSQRRDETCGDNEVNRWLASLGLSKYATAFAEAEIDMETLPFLGSSDLFQLGVETLGPRRKILHAIAQLQLPAPLAAVPTLAAGARRTSQLAHGEPMASMPKHPWQEEKRLSVGGQTSTAAQKPVFPIFTAEGAAAAAAAAAAGSATACSKTQPTSGPKPLTLAALARRAGGRGGRGGAFRPSGTRRGGGPSFFRGRNRERLPCPGWRIVEGTKFVVDEFKAKPPPGCSGFFLSHFHADHYGGLTKSFSDGLIYCSQATANLVISKLRVAKSRLCPLPLGMPKSTLHLHKHLLSQDRLSCARLAI